MTPILSVLMAVHNAERYVEQACRSVADNLIGEFVVVDDASTDRTPDILERFPSMFYPSGVDFVVTRLHHRTGQTNALIVGAAQCQGKFIARQDADDITLTHRFLLQTKYLRNHPDCAVVASRVQIIDEAGQVVRRGCQVRWCPRMQLRLGRNPIVHGSATFRREQFEAVGGYRQSFRFAQDADLWRRLGRLGRIHILPDELYQLREHAGRVSEKHGEQQRAWAQVARWAK